MIPDAPDRTNVLKPHFTGFSGLYTGKFHCMLFFPEKSVHLLSVLFLALEECNFLKYDVTQVESYKVCRIFFRIIAFCIVTNMNILT